MAFWSRLARLTLHHQQFYCLRVILPNLDGLHFLSFLDLTTRSVLRSLSFCSPPDGGGGGVKKACFHLSNFQLYRLAIWTDGVCFGHGQWLTIISCFTHLCNILLCFGSFYTDSHSQKQCSGCLYRPRTHLTKTSRYDKQCRS